MADITYTPGNVIENSATAATHVTATGTAGATITAGQPIYKDVTDSDHLKACQATSAILSDCVGIALHGASDGQPLKYLVSGELDYGTSVFTIGESYVVATTGGGIALESDLLTTNFPTTVGLATTADILRVSILAAGVAKP